MVPFIFIFLFMVVFDTLGTLIGVAEQAGLVLSQANSERIAWAGG
jgi:xanthine/uracil/vitamin C permease (AzgA family)